MSEHRYDVVDIVDARIVERFKVWLRFADGVSGVADVSDIASQGVFRRWQEPGEFERMYIDPESRTLAWPGGLDLAPEPLYDGVLQAAARA